uniref:Uncharacterized protein n=1 Tax=Populus trichocarpa TaxID=3694 RepID=A0A3N7G645_POPTR
MTRSKIERRLLVKNNKEVQSFWRDLLVGLYVSFCMQARLQASLLECVYVFDLRPKGFSRGQSCQLSSLAIVLSGGCRFRAMNTFLFPGGVYGGAAQCAPQWPGCLRHTFPNDILLWAILCEWNCKSFSVNETLLGLLAVLPQSSFKHAHWIEFMSFLTPFE